MYPHEPYAGKWLWVEARLTEREVEVVRRLCRGQTLVEIAAALGLARSSVEHEAYWVRRRLGLRNNQHLAAWGAAHGLSDFDRPDPVPGRTLNETA